MCPRWKGLTGPVSSPQDQMSILLSERVSIIGRQTCSVLLENCEQANHVTSISVPEE